jgi:hypothetical protein
VSKVHLARYLAEFDYRYTTRKVSDTARMAALAGLFGASVALSGTVALIGAPGPNLAGGYTGAAYVFSESGGVWSQRAKLNPSEARSFGSLVALSGTTALIGASGTDDHAGAAYVFSHQ